MPIDRPPPELADAPSEATDRPQETDRRTDTPTEDTGRQDVSWRHPDETPQERYQRALEDTAPGDALLDEGVRDLNAWTREHTSDGSDAADGDAETEISGVIQGDVERTHDVIDAWLPAVERDEWQEPLRLGEVDQVGLGIVDERARTFELPERRLAEYLAEPGLSVVARDEDSSLRGKKVDADVDGIATEFKSIATTEAADGTVLNTLNRGKRQSPHVVVDARGSGLPEPAAWHGITRFDGTPNAHKLDTIRIVGDAFDITRKRGN